jgi:hypothetical protein
MRLRLSRAKGFRLENASQEANGRAVVCVSRPGPWGNPFRVTAKCSASAAVAAYRGALMSGKLDYGVADIKARLGGKNLACWCALDAPCHGDVLLEIANA